MTRRHNLPAVTYATATVATTAPLTVYYDGDTYVDAVPIVYIAPGVTGLTVGTRVTVVFYGTIAVIAQVW
jgi:hypothetical protein